MLVCSLLESPRFCVVFRLAQVCAIPTHEYGMLPIWAQGRACLPQTACHLYQLDHHHQDSNSSGKKKQCFIPWLVNLKVWAFSVAYIWPREAPLNTDQGMYLPNHNHANESEIRLCSEPVAYRHMHCIFACVQRLPGESLHHTSGRANTT